MERRSMEGGGGCFREYEGGWARFLRYFEIGSSNLSFYKYVRRHYNFGLEGSGGGRRERIFLYYFFLCFRK